MPREDRRTSMKQALLNRTKESHEHRDDSGMYGDIFQEVEGLQKWKCKEGQHILDILPYVAGPHDPNTKEGEWTYLLDIWIHQRVGVNQDAFICPARNYDKPCPICEYREQLRGEDGYDEELVKSLYPKRRTIYNIICYDDQSEEKKGIQVWDVSHFFMEKKLMAIAKIPARGGTGGGYVAFADPEDGKSIQFERKGSGANNTEFLGHQFVNRDYKFDEEFCKTQTYKLDEIVEIPTYEQLKAVFFAEELGEGKGNGNGEPDKGEGEKEEVSTPAKPQLLRRGQVAQPPAQEEKPTRGAMRVKVGELTCPAGGTFGVDCEDLKECGECTFWDDCSAKKDATAAAKAAEEKPTPVRRGPTPAGAGKPATPPPTTTGSRRGLIGRK